MSWRVSTGPFQSWRLVLRLANLLAKCPRYSGTEKKSELWSTGYAKDMILLPSNILNLDNFQKNIWFPRLDFWNILDHSCGLLEQQWQRLVARWGGTFSNPDEQNPSWKWKLLVPIFRVWCASENRCRQKASTIVFLYCPCKSVVDTQANWRKADVAAG